MPNKRKEQNVANWTLDHLVELAHSLDETFTPTAIKKAINDGTILEELTIRAPDHRQHIIAVLTALRQSQDITKLPVLSRRPKARRHQNIQDKRSVIHPRISSDCQESIILDDEPFLEGDLGMGTPRRAVNMEPECIGDDMGYMTTSPTPTTSSTHEATPQAGTSRETLRPIHTSWGNEGAPAITRADWSMFMSKLDGFYALQTSLIQEIRILTQVIIKNQDSLQHQPMMATPMSASLQLPRQANQYITAPSVLAGSSMGPMSMAFRPPLVAQSTGLRPMYDPSPSIGGSTSGRSSTYR